MSAEVHATAVVSPSASLDRDVSVGPFCHVGADVHLGAGTVLVSHATVLGPAVLGEGNRVFPYATLGAAPQDRSYAGEPTTLHVGDHNEIREHVTMHRGTRKGAGTTRVGSGNLLMVGVHVAHDCAIGDSVTIANYTSLGGHVVVADGVTVGGHVAVAPFTALGRLCYVAGGAMVERNVPPFVIAGGDRARVRALNVVALERAGMAREEIEQLRRAVRALWFSKRPMSVARGELARCTPPTPLLSELLEALDEDAAGKLART